MSYKFLMGLNSDKDSINPKLFDSISASFLKSVTTVIILMSEATCCEYSHTAHLFSGLSSDLK